MKYSRDQLREMARTCIAAKQRSDARYLQIVMRLALRLGIAPAQAEAGIEELAKA